MASLGNIFTDFADWMAALPALWAYLTILVIAYGENVLPPIPGDMIVVFGGYLAGLGTLDLWVVILLSTIGGAAGFMTMYAIGYRIGDAVLDPDRLRWLPKKQIFKAQRWLRRWGYGVVLANRFLSGARSVISLTVGMAHMRPGRTTLFATLSALVWTALIGVAGYKVGENWEIVGVYLRTYGRFVVVALVAVVVLVVVRRYRKRRQDEREDEREDAAATTEAESSSA